MERNIKSKNIKFNININNDKLIVNYFDTHNDNFSKITKALLLEYIMNSKDENSKSIIDVLEDHTRLLKQIAEKGMVIDNLSSNNLKVTETKEEKKSNKIEEEKSNKIEEEKKENKGFNIDYLNQL
jgi:hypothetical protein